MTSPSLLLLALALSSGADNRFMPVVPLLEVSPDPLGDCARMRLKPFISPYNRKTVV